MRVSIDESGKEGMIRKLQIGDALTFIDQIARRGSFAGEQDLLLVIDQVHVVARSCADAVEQSSNVNPDAARIAGGGKIHRGTDPDQRSTGTASLQIAIIASI